MTQRKGRRMLHVEVFEEREDPEGSKFTSLLDMTAALPSGASTARVFGEVEEMYRTLTEG